MKQYRLIIEAYMQMSNLGPKHIILVIVTALAIVLMHSLALAAQKKGKPLPPVTVSVLPADPMRSSENIKPGDVVEFIVTAVALSDAEDLQISVTLPKGAVLRSGELSWSGPVSKNERRSLHFTVKTPDKHGGPIKARVIMPSTEGHSFSSTVHYSLGVQAKSKENVGVVRPPKKDSKGGDVIEYR